MESSHIRKLKNIIFTAPKHSTKWSEFRDQHPQTEVESMKRLVSEFLRIVSGGDTYNLLNDVLAPPSKDALPALNHVGDDSGEKRLGKLNAFIRRSKPLKPWTQRSNGSQKIRLEIELTARRSLAYLSGGQIVPMLEEIMYHNEKEAFCSQYRMALTRLGEAVKLMHPKAKGVIMSCLKQSGFAPEDLRSMNWAFSNHLWDVGGYHKTSRKNGARDDFYVPSSLKSQDPTIYRHRSRIYTTTLTSQSSSRSTLVPAKLKLTPRQKKKDKNHSDIFPPYGSELTNEDNLGQLPVYEHYSLDNFIVRSPMPGSNYQASSSSSDSDEPIINPMFPQII